MHAQCCTHVDQTRVISLPQVVKHGGLIQVGQTGHVLCLLKLWGIHLLRDIDIKHSLLKKTKYSQYMHVSYLCMHASLTLPLGNSTVTLSPLVLSTWAWANPCSASGTQSHFLESKAPPEPPLLGAARRYTSGSSLISSSCSCGLAWRDLTHTRRRIQRFGCGWWEVLRLRQQREQQVNNSPTRRALSSSVHLAVSVGGECELVRLHCGNTLQICDRNLLITRHLL